MIQQKQIEGKDQYDSTKGNVEAEALSPCFESCDLEPAGQGVESEL